MQTRVQPMVANAVVTVIAVMGALAATAGCAASKGEATGTAPARPNLAGAPGGTDPTSVSPDKLDEIDQFFHRKAAQLQFDCYNTETEKTGKKYQGNVGVALRVQPGGKTSDVKITSSTLDAPGIESCIIDAIKSWEWPDVNAPAPYTGSISFKPAW